MTMGWMEAIRFLGLDLMVATVFAVASLDAAACASKAAWGRIARDAPPSPGPFFRYRSSVISADCATSGVTGTGVRQRTVGASRYCQTLLSVRLTRGIIP